MTTPISPTPLLGFASLGLADALAKAVAALGYEEPTPIQREAIPVLLSGTDLIGQAGTGTGKTAAFALPLIQRLQSHPPATRGRARGLILVPTRELAMQVAEAVHKYAKRTTLIVVPLYGGAPMDQQIRALRRGADIIVATPGRALDHLRRQTLNLDRLEVLVLDEADQMRTLVESLAHTFEMVDIAAAAVAMIHQEGNAASPPINRSSTYPARSPTRSSRP